MTSSARIVESVDDHTDIIYLAFRPPARALLDSRLGLGATAAGQGSSWPLWVAAAGGRGGGRGGGRQASGGGDGLGGFAWRAVLWAAALVLLSHALFHVDSEKGGPAGAPAIRCAHSLATCAFATLVATLPSAAASAAAGAGAGLGLFGRLACLPLEVGSLSVPPPPLSAPTRGCYYYQVV